MSGTSDDGQSGVTEDLAKARTLVTHADYCSGFGDRGDECICGAAEIAERVAVALAAEREKARAPFRRTALDVKDGWQPSADRLADAILIYTGGYDAENTP